MSEEICAKLLTVPDAVCFACYIADMDGITIYNAYHMCCIGAGRPRLCADYGGYANKTKCKEKKESTGDYFIAHIIFLFYKDGLPYLVYDSPCAI